MVCSAYSEALAPRDMLELAETFSEAYVQDLKYVGQQPGKGAAETQYIYELNGQRLYVTFCPEGYTGTIAAVALDN
jgi:hypothetical protein